MCLCVCHIICPDDLTMQDWCHTNNILQVHSWGYRVVQFMFLAFMTSKTNKNIIIKLPAHRYHGTMIIFTQFHIHYVKFKNCYISINISARASVKSSKYLKCTWQTCWRIQIPVLLAVKCLSRPQNGVHFKNCKSSIQLHFDCTYVEKVPN